MLSTAAGRAGRSPTKMGSVASASRPLSKSGRDKGNEDRTNVCNFLFLLNYVDLS